MGGHKVENQRWGLWNTSVRYGVVAKLIHWIVAVMIPLMLAIGFYMSGYLTGGRSHVFYPMHKQAGIVLLMVMIVRSVNAYLRHVNNKDRCVYHLFYCVLLSMPLSGWVMSSSAGHPPVLGGVKLALIGPGPRWLTKVAGQCHFWLAWVLLGLVAWHLWHMVQQWRKGIRLHRRMFF